MADNRPPPLPVTETKIWRSVNGTDLIVDIYLSKQLDPTGPFLFYLHGGSWMTGTRDDYCQPLFQRFLDKGCSIASFEYRLLPEATWAQICEDVRAMEEWGRENVAGKIIICGCSAGSHLAMYAATKWKQQPAACLITCPVTNLYNTPYLAEERHSKIPPLSSTEAEILELAINSSGVAHARFNPSTEINGKERTWMCRSMLEKGIAVFLLKRIQKNENGERSFHKSDCVSAKEIESINPYHWVKDCKMFPPLLILVAGGDDIFDVSNTLGLHCELLKRGIPCERIVVPKVGHAFDMSIHSGDELDKKYVFQVVSWIVNSIQ